MSRLHALQILSRHALLACSLTTLLSLTSAAQTSESDPVTQPSAGYSNPRGTDTQHHEAGSVEASAPEMRDRLFLREATVAEMSEIQFSQLALQQGAGDDVKQFATSIISDHTKILDGLKSAAETQGVMLPTKLPSREQVSYERLKALSGEDFDREYIKMMSEDHHRDLRKFRAEAASAQDPSLRRLAQDASTLFHNHLVLADQIARTKGFPVSRSARADASPAP